MLLLNRSEFDIYTVDFSLKGNEGAFHRFEWLLSSCENHRGFIFLQKGVLLLLLLLLLALLRGFSRPKRYLFTVSSEVQYISCFELMCG